MNTDESLEHGVACAIKRAHYALRTSLDNALRDLGITAAQWGVLMCLRHHAGASNAELARFNACTPQTMNAIVMHLEGQGLVERHRHESHGTVMPAQLTDAGFEIACEAERRVNLIERRMLGNVPPSARAQLLASLDQCVVALHAEFEETGCCA